MQVFRAIISDWNGGSEHDLGVFASREAARKAISHFGTPYDREHWEKCIRAETVWTDGAAFITSKQTADQKAHEDYLKRVEADNKARAEREAKEQARKAFEADKRAAFEKALAAEWAAAQ